MTSPVTRVLHNALVINTKPEVERGEHRNATIFTGRKKEMSRAELQRVVAPAVARWIAAACVWDDTAIIGDHRFVIFEIRVAPKVLLYVQFWSEPLEPVLWEVSSGRWNPPADKWLAGDRSRRIEAFGFEIGGNAENYEQVVDVRTPADALRVARTVVDVFYAAFDFRGLRPISAQLVYESRAETRFAYDSTAGTASISMPSALSLGLDDDGAIVCGRKAVKNLASAGVRSAG